MTRKPTSMWGKIWHFLYEDDSLMSWIVNVILAFIIIKFIFYPGMGAILGTTHPVVAVVSGSMEHDGNFDAWWSQHADLYNRLNITKEEFKDYPFPNGFNKGDIMILKGQEVDEIKRGDIIVAYWPKRQAPIIHRVVHTTQDDANPVFVTKGDANAAIGPEEQDIRPPEIVGYAQTGKGSVAIGKIPFLGYLKIWATTIMRGAISLIQFIL